MRDAIDMLLDPSCTDDLILYDENGRECRFAQIAYIPLDGRRHAILRGLFAQDEATVFTVEYESAGRVLVPERDEKTAERVFEEYERLFRKQQALSEAERHLRAVRAEHGEFMANFPVLPPLAREMDDYVKKHLCRIPSTQEGRAFMASAIAEYRDTLLENAMELVEDRGMIRNLGNYDLALERLLYALAEV